VNDEQFLASDRGRIREVVVPTSRERYRAALAERTFAERQVERLRRQLDPMTATTTDPIELQRRIGMVHQLLPSACQRLRSAIERCMALRPASPPSRPRREPSPVVWLNQPAAKSRAAARGTPAYLTRDLGNLHFQTGADWLNYCAATTGWRRGGRL
jgi:hypothetical protein